MTDTVDAAELEAEEIGSDKVAHLYARLFSDTRSKGKATSGRGANKGKKRGATTLSAPTTVSNPIDLTSLSSEERLYAQLRTHPSHSIDNYSELQERALAFIEANLSAEKGAGAGAVAVAGAGQA